MKHILITALLAFSVPAFAYSPSHHHHINHEIGGNGAGYTNVDGKDVHFGLLEIMINGVDAPQGLWTMDTTAKVIKTP